MEEIWKPIQGYEGLYSVSSFGNVRRDKGGIGMCKAGRILKKTFDSHGYHIVGLCKDGINTVTGIHKLVASHFIGPKPVGLSTNHKDGVKINNYFENLEYVTSKQNTQHALKLGLLKNNTGENHYRAKVTEKEVAEIRAKYVRLKFTLLDLSILYNLSITQISRIIKRESWKQV